MTFDIEHQVRTDPVYRAKLVGMVTELEKLEQASKLNPKVQPMAAAKLVEILRFCDYNMFFLPGYFFPNYLDGQPMSFADYPFASPMLSFQIGSILTLRGSRQIGKSVNLSVRQILHANLIPGYKSLYICPHPKQLEAYSIKLKETERAFRFYTSGGKEERRNLFLKEYGTGVSQSTITLMYVLGDAGVIRGRTADSLLLDECQAFDADLETEVSQVNSASKKPATIYAGTSTTTDSYLEAKFQESSQGYAAIKCTCGHVNIPLPEHKVLDMIQSQGPTCTKVYKSGAHCGRLLNVRSIEYVHANQAALALNKPGYHIPQIIVPGVVENRFRWAKIYDRKFGPNLNKYFQELLGIPTEEGDRELSRAHLEAICVLPDQMTLKRKAMARQYEYVVSGCDWGGTDYSSTAKLKVSTTVHVAMGITPDGWFDIIHMKRYLGMDFESVGEDIMHNHKELQGCAIGSDTGVGMAYNAVLGRHTPPETHLKFTYVGPKSAVIAEPQGDHAYNQWSINKTETLTMLFQAIKARRIRCYPWEEASALLSDFLNMYRAPADLPGGASIMTYRPSATKPNDCMQACNYAFIVGKILLGEPVFADESVRMRLEMALRGGSSMLGQMMTGMRPVSG